MNVIGKEKMIPIAVNCCQWEINCEEKSEILYLDGKG